MKSVMKRSEPSRTATAYLCSPGFKSLSFIRPVTTIFVAIFTSHPLDAAVVTMKYNGFLSATSEGLEGICQAAFRLRDDRCVNRAAIFMRLLASTAAATHISNRTRPSARQRFMPRPRNNTEMRPSIISRSFCPYRAGCRYPLSLASSVRTNRASR